MGGYLDVAGAVLLTAGGLGSWWAVRRSSAAYETLGETALPARAVSTEERDQLRAGAQSAVGELRALADKAAGGEQLTPLEHARMAQLVAQLGTIEHRPV